MEQNKIMLIVDDEEINRAILRKTFENEYTILEEENGDNVIDIMHNNINNLEVVLLDLVMPKTDGFTVLKKIQADPTLNNIPVIAVTAKETTETEALKLGAWDFISKPYDINIIRLRVKNVTSRKYLSKFNLLQMEEERKKHELELLSQQFHENERYEIVARQAGLIVFEWDIKDNHFYVSDNIDDLEMSNLSRTTLFSTGYSSKTIFNEDVETMENELFNPIKEGKNEAETTVRFKHKKGNYIWCRVNTKIFRNDKGEVIRVIGSIKDVNNEVNYLNKLKYDARYDMLTGIYNSSAFFVETRRILNNNPDTDFAMLRLDIARFKTVNELFGNNEGDRLLQYIAHKIREVLKEFPVCAFGRINSDIFCICIPCDNKMKIARTIKNLENICKGYSLDLDLFPSIGIYNITDKDATIDLMCDRANLALQKIKGNYLIRHAYFDEELSLSLIKEQEILNDMNDALEKHEFKLYLQPKVDLLHNKISGAEALVRWIKPNGKLLSPNEFIPIFERNGFIMKLDAYMWEEVCKLLREWIDSGKTVLPISVNISKVNLYNPQLCETIISLVDKYKVPPKYFQLELTESAYTDNKALLNNITHKLQRHGFIILMDDFGSGYSSLNMLKEISVDVLKIDLNFLSTNEETKEKGNKILSSIVHMAQWLDLDVIAEGIETKEQFEFLQGIGCPEGQGYYFSKPIPVPEFLEELKKEYLPSEKLNTDIKIDLDALWSPSAQINLIFNNIISAIAIYEVCDDKIRILRANDGYHDVTGYSHKEIEEHTVYLNSSLNDEKTIKKVLKMFHEAQKDPKTYKEIEYQRKNKDDKLFWVCLRVKFLSKVGNKSIFYGAIRDISSQKASEEKISETLNQINKQFLLEHAYKKAITSNAVGFFEANLTQNEIIDIDTTQVNKYNMELSQKSFDSLISSLSGFVHKSDLRVFEKYTSRDFLLKQFNTDKREFSFECRVHNANEGFIWVEILLSLFNINADNDIYCMIIAKDINHKKQYEYVLKEKSERDALTGLYNCVSFENHATTAIEKHHSGSFYMLDIDNFKKINDLCGHAMGDDVLKRVSGLLSSIFKTGAYISRIGGDEFSVFVYKNQSDEEIIKFSESVCNNIQNIIVDDKSNIKVTCSLGISRYTPTVNSFNKLYTTADKAQYIAKKNGKNGYSLYKENSETEKETILIVDDIMLHRAILKELLSPKYNIIEASNGIEAEDIIKEKGNLISLIILDNKMPIKTGLEVLEDIASKKLQCDIPIIVTTMFSEPEVKNAALDLGALYFITKPFDNAQVLKIVDNVISSLKN